MGRLEGLLDRLGGHFGLSWGPLGPSWGPLGCFLGLLGAILEAARAVMGFGEAEKARKLKSFKNQKKINVFGLWRRSCGRSWSPLGPSWVLFGPSWGHLGPSWGRLGPSWGHLEPSWGPLRPPRGPTCPNHRFSIRFGTFWGPKRGGTILVRRCGATPRGGEGGRHM